MGFLERENVLILTTEETLVLGCFMEKTVISMRCVFAKLQSAGGGF
jgi:hypothetical protein